MSCIIEWNNLTPDQWQECLAVIPRSNLLQHPAYAAACRRAHHQRPRFGLIRINRNPAGIFQMLEVGILWNAVHAVMLDRGPLWFSGQGGAAHTKMFFEEFNRQFPARLGRKRRILPETDDGPAARKILDSTGLKRMDTRKGYQTLWLDLTPDTKTLEQNLRPNWHGSLKKALRGDVTVEWTYTSAALPDFIGQYAADRDMKGYGGPTPSFLNILATELSKTGDMMIGRARLDGADIAAVMIARHGRTATYLAGWSGAAGRETAAHHLLLWRALNVLKEKDVKELDLGGINDETAIGVKTFKEGLGGSPFTGVGHYI